MKLRSLARRPSPAIIISSAALFMSLGGVGYAAVTIPTNSVGNAQIKNNAVNYKKIEPGSVGNVRLDDNGVSNSKIANNAVSYKKIAPGSVGTVRADLNQLQARLRKTCPAGQAVGGVDNKGNVTCNAALPAEYGAASASANLTTSATTVASVNLPSGQNYLAFANPTINVTSGATPQNVVVSCTLTVGSVSSTRNVTVHTSGTDGTTQSGAMALQLAGPAGASSVACTSGLQGGGAAPATSATTGINTLGASSIN